MRQQHLLLLAALAIATTSSACSVLVDGALQDRDTNVGIDVNLPDAFLPDVFVPTTFCEMAGVNDGDYCSLEGSLDLRVCDNNLCVRSSCGDGFLDDRMMMASAGGEDCDDGNDVDGDGCDSDCSFSCDSAADCDDANVCTDDVCSAAHICAHAPNTATCMLLGTSATCSGGVCPLGCGNGRIDMDETCDDGNAVSGDGCERDCTPSCTSNMDCEDGIACNGISTCGVAGVPVAGARRCETTAPTPCPDDGNACTAERCDNMAGCVSDGSANDRDSDGHYATSCGGDDCDDMNAGAHPGLAEICGNMADDDCSATTPDDTRTAYFVDCDRDGYATSMTGSMLVCMAPTAAPAGCAGGRWTTTVPLDIASTDCNGSNADVSPSQTAFFTVGIPSAPAARDFDYNCDGMETAQYASALIFCRDLRGTCSGSSYYTTAPVCGASNVVNRCIRDRLGACSYAATSSALVACH